MGGGRSGLAAILVVLVLAATPAAALAGAVSTPPSPLQEGTIPSPTAFVPFSPNVRVNSGATGFDYQVEPTMVVNSTGHVFVGWKEAITASGGGQRVAFSHSGDGGATWALNVVMPLSNPGWLQSDPWLTVTTSDRVYFTRIEYLNTFSPGGIAVTNTTDGVMWGTTWFYDDAPRFADKESAAHDAAGNLYWVWNSDFPTYDLAFSRSNDGGRTWTPKVYVNDQPNTLGGIVQVAANGTVLATWWETPDFRTGDILFDRSFDGGLTWGQDIRVNTFANSAMSPSRWILPIPAMAVAPNGTIYVTWADSGDGDRNIVVSHSVDGGTTWSWPVRVNDDTGPTTQYMPDLAIDPWGGLHVAWEDARTGQRNIYYANSTNGGVTFGPNVQVSTAGTPLTYDRPGDYLAIESAPDGTIDIVWTDGRGADLDIYFASLPPDPRTKIDTVPAGLSVQLDGNTFPAPYFFNCTSGPPHVIGAPSPQIVGGLRYSFSSWSDGLNQTHGITCGSTKSYTAYFSKEYAIGVATSPPNLNATVDGTPVTTPYTFYCTPSSIHDIGTDSPQETGGARHVFASWSDGGAQNHSVVCIAPATYRATFATEYQVTLATSPPGLLLSVDGSAVVAPRTYWWPQDSNHALDVTSPQGTGGLRYLFSAWSDGGAPAHNLTATGPATVTATFRTQYHLTVVSPRGSPSCDVADCWYDGGATATFSVNQTIFSAGTGSQYAFTGWTGDSIATTRQADVAMTAPRTVTATWAKQHLLTIESPYGTPQGAGWYAEGDTANVTIESTVIVNGTTYRFTGWTGDAVGTNASAGFPMDGPKTIRATWEAVPPAPPQTVSGTLFAGIVLLAVIILLLVALFLWRRRKKGEPEAPPPRPPES